MSEFGMPKRDILKDDFGWDIPVETVPLPSRGVIYNPDSFLYNRESLNIKAMTAHEEDILSSAAFIKEGTSVIRAIKSCITDPDVDVDEMIAGDRNALMVSMRITGYGSSYPVHHSCASCRTRNEVTVELNNLSINRLDQEPVEKGKNLFEYILPVTGKKVRYKFLTGRDEREDSIKRDRLEKAGIVSNNTVTSFLERSIVSIDNVDDKNKISHFVKNMPALDSRKLRLHIINSEPGIDMSWEYQCSTCGTDNSFNIPITSEFFWPRT